MNDLHVAMHQMEIRLSNDIRKVGECVVRVEGRLDEKQSSRHAEELV